MLRLNIGSLGFIIALAAITAVPFLLGSALAPASPPTAIATNILSGAMDSAIKPADVTGKPKGGYLDGRPVPQNDVLPASARPRTSTMSPTLATFD